MGEIKLDQSIKIMNKDITYQEAIDHAVFECMDCNIHLTKLFQHTLQSKCKHRWEKLHGKVKGCRKCMKTVELKS